MSQLFQELKRRNVFRVAIAYLAVAWVILQAADIVFDSVKAPDWLMQVLLFFIVIGFVVALFIAWAYELTPEGIKPERQVDRSTSIADQTGKKLDRMIIGVLGIAVVFLLIDKFVLSDAPASVANATGKSVAVLPFIAMSSGPDDEYFADGLTEEILNSLTRLPELLVTARTSAFHFKGKDLPVPEIATSLGVAHVVEGSVRRDGNRLRVTAQLIRASDGFHLWSENYDRGTEDTFGVQSDIAEKIASALEVVMDSSRRERMRAAGIRDPEAFIAYQKGIEIFDLAHGSDDLVGRLLEANRWFDRALVLAPNLSGAYLLHSDYYTHFLMNNLSNDAVSEDDRTAAFAHIERDLENAIRTSPDEPSRLAAELDLATISGQWRSLPSLFEQMVANPGCARAGWQDMTSVSFGKAQKSLLLEQKQIECNPLQFNGWSGASAAYLNAGDIDASIEIAKKGLLAIPHVRIYQALSAAYLAAGRFDAAEQVIDQNLRGERLSVSERLLLAAARGDDVLTQALLREITEENPDIDRHPITPLAVAGQYDRVNRLAAELDSRRYGHIVLMINSTICYCGAPWDIEKTPNFAQLLRDANLPWPPASPINWPLKNW